MTQPLDQAPFGFKLAVIDGKLKAAVRDRENF